MVHPKTERNPRGAGRKPKAGTAQLRDKRRFFMLEKNDRTIAMMKAAQHTYRGYIGKDGSFVDLMCAALAVYASFQPAAKNESAAKTLRDALADFSAGNLALAKDE